MRSMPRAVLCAATFLGLSASNSMAPAAETTRPNVVIFLADDLGYGETGFQGNPEIPTPQIDSIARNGVRFTQGYVSGPYCSPTRAGLMTGRYQTRFGHEWNPHKPENGLPLSETTIADRLKKLGYATCAIGKWHLGGSSELRPSQRGFDEFYGTLNNTPFFHPTNFVDSRISDEVRSIDDPNFYTTDAYAARAVEWIEAHKHGPFLLYLPFNAQHAPLQASQKYLDRFPSISDEKRRIFAAMMSGMDDAIGQVLGALRKNQLEERTLVFFFADNGGPTPSTTSKNDPLRGVKMTTAEGGVRVPFAAQWKGQIPAGTVFEHPIIQLDLLPTAVVAAGGTIDPAWKLDGVDLMPYLKGQKAGRPHDTLFWRLGEQWAVRHGDWKLVKSRLDASTALFNLATDVSESRDEISSQPERAKELQAIYDRWNAEQATALWVPGPAKARKNAAKEAAAGKPKKKTSKNAS